jgi:CDP-glycerol glycerophosphotransferase
LNTEQEVLQALGRIDQVSKLYEKRYRAWQQKFNSLEDGGSAARVVDLVWGAK